MNFNVEVELDKTRHILSIIPIQYKDRMKEEEV